MHIILADRHGQSDHLDNLDHLDHMDHLDHITFPRWNIDKSLEYTNFYNEIDNKNPKIQSPKPPYLLSCHARPFCASSDFPAEWLDNHNIHMSAELQCVQLFCGCTEGVVLEN